MTSQEFIRVADAEQLQQGKTMRVELQGREVLLCHTAEGVFAVDNLCTHGAGRLCEGKLKGHRILCPVHGATFDVRDGSALTRPAVRALASHAVRIEGADILIAVSD